MAANEHLTKRPSDWHGNVCDICETAAKHAHRVAEPLKQSGKTKSSVLLTVLLVLGFLAFCVWFVHAVFIGNPDRDAYEIACREAGGYVETMTRSLSSPWCSNNKLPPLDDWKREHETR